MLLAITIEDFAAYQKALFLDMVYVQQDAFDEVDASCALERQKLSFNKVYQLVNREYNFTDKPQIHDYFTRLTGLYKNFNYAAKTSLEYSDLLNQIDQLAESMDIVQN